MANNAIQLMREESVTNGVWFALLSQAFPFPQYIIAPEHWSAGARRGDLFVLRVDNGSYKPVFAFEGKRFDAEGNFESNVPQIRGYMRDLMKGTRGYGFGVLAVGPQYAILQDDGSFTYTRNQAIVAGGGITNGIIPKIDPGDLNNHGELATVNMILVSIEGWIRRNVN